MSQWSLALLGTPEVRYSGRLIAFPTRKALALLIYLVVEGGMHSREKLMALFWPESDGAQGRGTLRSTLAYQRNALRGVNQVPPLIRERDSLGFDFSSDFDLDLHRLQAAFTLARAPSEGHTMQSQAHYELLNQVQACSAPLSRSFSRRVFPQRCSQL